MADPVPFFTTFWPTGDPDLQWWDHVQPVPLHRARVVFTGRRASTYLTDADEIFRSELQVLWMKARIREPLAGPLAVAMEFSGQVRYGGRRRTQPDVSNLIKAVEDAGNGVLWEDDRQIVQLAASIRRWDAEAQPFIAIFAWHTPWPAVPMSSREVVSA